MLYFEQRLIRNKMAPAKEPKKYDKYLKKGKEKPMLPNYGGMDYWNIIYHWNPDGTSP